MIQSMEILQLNMMALNERIEQELVENVTLELVDKDKDAPVAEPDRVETCLLYTSPSPRDKRQSRMPSSA